MIEHRMAQGHIDGAGVLLESLLDLGLLASASLLIASFYSSFPRLAMLLSDTRTTSYRTFDSFWCPYPTCRAGWSDATHICQGAPLLTKHIALQEVARSDGTADLACFEGDARDSLTCAVAAAVLARDSTARTRRGAWFRFSSAFSMQLDHVIPARRQHVAFMQRLYRAMSEVIDLRLKNTAISGEIGQRVCHELFERAEIEGAFNSSSTPLMY